MDGKFELSFLEREQSDCSPSHHSSFLMLLFQVEEEEYTSRIIHYFISGLLTLPEGATLRSYLADKLNCDPMRITKKYAGASCLGRRVYHFRDRVHPTVGEIQVAKAELDHLEQRFRLRIEGRQSCMIWTPASGAAAPAAVPAEMVPSISQHAANGSTAGANVAGARSSQGNNNNNVLPTQLVTVNHSALQAQNLLQTLLLGMNGGNAPSKLAVAQSVAGLATQQQQPMFASPPLMGPGSTTNHTIPSMPPSVSQYLLPNGTQPGTESAQQYVSIVSFFLQWLSVHYACKRLLPACLLFV